MPKPTSKEIRQWGTIAAIATTAAVTGWAYDHGIVQAKTPPEVNPNPSPARAWETSRRIDEPFPPFSTNLPIDSREPLTAPLATETEGNSIQATEPITFAGQLFPGLNGTLTSPEDIAIEVNPSMVRETADGLGLFFGDKRLTAEFYTPQPYQGNSAAIDSRNVTTIGGIAFQRPYDDEGKPINTLNRTNRVIIKDGKYYLGTDNLPLAYGEIIIAITTPTTPDPQNEQQTVLAQVGLTVKKGPRDSNDTNASTNAASSEGPQNPGGDPDIPPPANPAP